MPARPWLRLVNSGLLFLSKYEILEESWEGYRKAAWQDEFAAKGIGVVTVEISENGVNYGKIRVFGTHMQAGNTKSEQVARKSQAEQVAAFIGQKEDDKIPLVFAGDLNMGPRQDPECNEFSVHYSNHTDAVARCSTYEHMVSGSQLEEVPSTVPSEYGSDICRFLVNGIDPAKCELTYEGLRGEDGRDLSDTKPMCLTIKLDPL